MIAKKCDTFQFLSRKRANCVVYMCLFILWNKCIYRCILSTHAWTNAFNHGNSTIKSNWEKRAFFTISKQRTKSLSVATKLNLNHTKLVGVVLHYERGKKMKRLLLRNWPRREKAPTVYLHFSCWIGCIQLVVLISLQTIEISCER